jgi:hypothetical protein
MTRQECSRVPFLWTTTGHHQSRLCNHSVGLRSGTVEKDDGKREREDREARYGIYRELVWIYILPSSDIYPISTVSSHMVRVNGKDNRLS